MADCGLAHCGAVTSDGSLWTWGSAMHGKLASFIFKGVSRVLIGFFFLRILGVVAVYIYCVWWPEVAWEVCYSAPMVGIFVTALLLL